MDRNVKLGRDLRPLPLADVGLGSSQRIITMGVGQWDSLLAAAYDDGWILLELDDDERPVAAYRKADHGR